MKALFAVLLLAVMATAASAQIDENTLVPVILAEDAEVIPGQYIVVFRPEVSLEHARIFADSISIGRVFNIGNEFKAVAGPISEDLLARIRRRSDLIDFIEPDQIVRVDASQSNATWGLDRSDQASLPLNSKFNYYDSAGSGVNVYVVDTGINHGHTDFGGRAKNGYNFHGGNSNANDDNGHGTHCAGTVGGKTWGMAKKATLYSVKVLGANGSGSLSNVAAGVSWHKKSSNKKTIASMSLGGGANNTVDNAVRSAITAGVSVIVAAGNENRDACNSSPARVSTAVTVSASDKNDTRASFSNYGSCSHIFAPGVSITSTWIGSSSATKTISGTSMACPHVAGAAALMMGQSGALSPATVKNNLINNSTKNKIKDVKGTPNRLLFAKY
ncbi:hypothetical protein H696_04769 [Fonticula alba]|uniref:Peptidase S8/S53 domain-containing protein n=1 Tax=Fonticula alba TaxID=691883 RepID=A0A058Z2L8_FONAL|nr:hypothetical protein H696_04769 [Fonticula alba]KCV68475.1 hypothetical protein H696_04769 [Fonticula alba]|eukprot:XP_009496907.1 hypothetical protein H696_04769 [Fonticula alba]